MNYIFVLAGGLKNRNEVHDFVSKRLDMAIQEYQKDPNNTKIICLGGGTYHKESILDNNNIIVYESNICATYLIKFGIPEKDIYREWASYDTLANSYFSYLKFIIPLQISTYTVITSDFHMKRTKEIYSYFHKLFFNNMNNIKFISVENYKIDSETLNIRRHREQNTLQKYKNTIFKIDNVIDFTKWFYTQHNSYRAIPEYPKSELSLQKLY